MGMVNRALVAALALVAGPALAKNDAVLQGPEPDWVHPSELLPVPADADGLVFVRRQDTLVHLDATGQANYQNQYYKLLHPQALQLGNVGISWNPAVGAPVFHALRIHRDGAVIDVLKIASFEILRREDQLEQAMLDGMLTAVLRVPDLRVGDELEMSFTTRGEDPTLRDESAGLLMMVGNMQPGRYRLGLSWDEGQEPQRRVTPDLAAYMQAGKRSLDIRADNPPVLNPPKDAPLRYSWQRIVEFTDFADWPDVSRRFAPLYAKAAQLDPASPLRAEVARIRAAYPDDHARAQAALELVQQQVRYIYVGLDGGNYSPATADETWQRRYGDCKGKTVLLLALLSELGIAAEPVLASNSGADDGYDARLPLPGLFDHVLVRATVGGKALWMDGTLPPVAQASAEPFLPYRWVLPLDRAGRALEAVPPRRLHTPEAIGLFEIDARAGFEKPARIVSTTVKRGLAGLSEYIEFSALTKDQLKAAFTQALAGDATWDSIDSVSYRYDPAARASVLSLTGTGPVEWDDDGDDARSLVLPGGGFNPPGRRVRPDSSAVAVPFYTAPDYDCRVTTVRLPKDTKPGQWSHNAAFDTALFGSSYYRAFSRRDDSITMIRGYRVERPEITVADATRDNARITRFDNSKALIFYKPHKTGDSITNEGTVPATDEIDWTAANVPCLPPDLLER